MASFVLGNLSSTPIVRNDILTSTDPTDIFQFSTSSFGNLNLALTNISNDDDADLQLFRDDGDSIFEPTSGDEFISAGPRPGNQDDSINIANLAKGKYFLNVSRFDLGSSGDVSYQLALSAADSSNLLPTEFQVGNLSANQGFNGNVNNSDTADVYAFSLDSFEGANIVLGSGSGNADIRLIQDRNGNDIVDKGEVLQSSSALGSQPDAIQVDDAGDYLLQVNQASGDSSNYNLIFGYFTNPFSEQTLGNLSDTPIVRNDTLTSSDPTDVFLFSTKNLGATSNINLALTNITAGDDANLRLFRDDGDLTFEPTSDDVFISTAARGTNVDDSINVADLFTGDYFAEVSRSDQGSSGNVSYQLSLSSTDPNNLLLNENPVGNLSKDLVINANVNNSDTSDFFPFSLDFSEGADIILNPKGGNADIRLIADSNENGLLDQGEVLVSSKALGSQTDTIRINDAGDYLLQVYQVKGDPINYSLTLDYFTEPDTALGIA